MAASKKKVRKAFRLMECAVAALNDRIAEFKGLKGLNSAEFSPTFYNAWQRENTARLELIEEDLVDVL